MAVTDIKKKYSEFECGLFRRETESATQVLKDTEALLAFIRAQQDKLEE